MRQIKFRGFDAIGNKGWVYGDLVHSQRVTVTGLRPRVMVAGYEVIPETIGQFTGLTDINGKEIYEGDVLHFDDHNYRMVWLDNTGEFAALKIEHSMLNPPVNYCVVSFWCKKDLKIIGNIYDDPELIEDMNIQMKED